MKKLVCEGVQLDYTNLYGEDVVFDATITLAKDDDGEWHVESAVAEEDNEVFGVKKGDSFDPGDTLDVEILLSEYLEEGETK